MSSLLVFLCWIVGCGARIEPTPPRSIQQQISSDAPPPAARQHVVQRGETLSALARWYGVRVEELTELNGIAEPDRIYAGQRLILPPLARSGTPSAPRPSPAADPAREFARARGGEAPGTAVHQLSAVEVALDRAEADLREARFEDALREVQIATAVLAANGAQEIEARIRIAEVIAHVYAARGEIGAAVRAYEGLLEIAPRYTPPVGTPPKLQKAFESAVRRRRVSAPAAPHGEPR